jgi:acyl-CoA thioester hydrolase
VPPATFADDDCRPSAPDLMPHAHATELRVRYAETDRMGIVYYANYLVWCEVGRVEFMRDLGRSYAVLETEGYGLAVAEARVRYLSPARFDDLVRVETTLASVRSRAVTFDYVISHAESGTRLATAHTALVSIDGSGRPTSLPQEFRAVLEGAL